MENILPTLISSAVIAALIASMTNMLLNRKNNSLQYITSERNMWRTELREIAERITNAKTDAILQKCISKLKLYLNPYGRNTENRLKDSHIWRLVEDIEKKNCSVHDTRGEREILFSYLLLLIKYDWERSKREIATKIEHVILGVVILLGAGYIIYNHLFDWGYAVDAYFLLLLLAVVAFPFLIGIFKVGLFDKKDTVANSRWKHILKRTFSVLLLLLMIILMVGLLLCSLIIYVLDDKEIPEMEIYVIAVEIACGYSWGKLCIEDSIHREYLQQIDKIKADNTKTDNIPANII